MFWWRKRWDSMSRSFPLLLAGSLLNYLKQHDLCKLIGADGIMRLLAGLVCISRRRVHFLEALSQEKTQRNELPRDESRGAAVDHSAWYSHVAWVENPDLTS